MDGNQFASSGEGNPRITQLLPTAKASQDSEALRSPHCSSRWALTPVIQDLCCCCYSAAPVIQLLHFGNSLFPTNTEILLALFSNFSIVPCCPLTWRKTKTAPVQRFPFSLLHMTLIDIWRLRKTCSTQIRLQTTYAPASTSFLQSCCFVVRFLKVVFIIFLLQRVCTVKKKAWEKLELETIDRSS